MWTSVVRGASLVRRPFAAAAFATVGLAVTGGISAGGRHSLVTSSLAEAAAAPPGFVRVVSYNVLSSHLCEPDHFLKCAPADLDPATRRQRVEALLKPQCEAEAVICLQEMSVQWVGEMAPFFEKAGYTVVSGNYGNPFNGYMGCSLAWPAKRFEAEAVDIKRAADVKPWPKRPKKPLPPRLVQTWRAIKRIWGLGEEPQPPFNPHEEASRRHNMLVSARLRCKRSGDTWRPTIAAPLASAYVAVNGAEPEFTNLAVTKFNKPDEPPFCETLDYIFLGDGAKFKWRALSVRPLPKRAEVLPTCSSYPSATEPSDHTAIWVDLELTDAF
ncbi:hypothetical protein Ctob_001863 [Chrysochromulina tobinii]|uniref:Endonuclease/exonuclease/phosphatase domain-containing protein n=1 Tax=Chrysochromulina tobinii TaxID=1460289 RepID=A0A0M0JRH0_9EUKA|nr:hypothetical protein Ctob_001863 [Chrysochromulina tobinii]|eukprot:KOO29065.1 hypothetical protein Ctob_001863 [Chrysochromulina sp. CCMP291]